MSDDTFFPEEMAPEAVAPAPAPELKQSSITISFLPGQAGQRKSILCAQYEGKAPLFSIIPETEIGELPQPISDLINRIQIGQEVPNSTSKNNFNIPPIKAEPKKPEPKPAPAPLEKSVPTAKSKSLSLWD